MKIAVVGCGISGMASATALARQGHDVTIHERFSTPRPLGAGLLLQPSGLDALDRLGLKEGALAAGARIDRLHGCTPKGRRVMDLRYGEAKPDEFGVGIHRASLFDLLHNAALESGAAIVTGAEITGIEHFDAPRLTLNGGDTAGPFDLVLIGDGAHSALRRTICPKAHDPVYPWGATWAVLEDPGGQWTARRDLAQVYDACSVMIGILPVGHDPARPECAASVSLFWSLRPDEEADWRAAGIDAFRSTIEAHWPEAAELLSGQRDLSAFTLATYRDVRCSPWHRGKVLLIGDAAHGTSPQLGQGANLALCDAVALSEAIGAGKTTHHALVRYRRRRRPAIRFYTWASWALTPVFQSRSRFLAFWRDLLFGPVSRLPIVRNLMASTLTGRGRLPPWGSNWD